MPKQKPLTDAKGEVRELTAKDLKTFRPARAALPESLRRKTGTRGQQKSPTKERITIRLSREVLQRFRATGEGWQTRMDAVLKEWLKKHKRAA
ncbi:MAG: BrnA antitoxin family protein [Gammaproteobacteria bacterium]|nr:BrnA antitoxin family protein [Gammaproteobacteria bacterium]